jgi:hypothetical protein
MKEEYVAVLEELNDVFERLKKFHDVSLVIGGAVPSELPNEGNCMAACYGDISDIANIIHSLIRSNPLIILRLIAIKAEEDLMNSNQVANVQPI